jgi:pimeloyl-ACP methyl ester carboxylesterase
VDRAPERLFDWSVHVVFRDVARADEEALDRLLLRRAAWQGEADCAALHDPRFRRALAGAGFESHRQGQAANNRLARLLTQPWPFAVPDVRCPRMFLWHGLQDRLMPAAGAHRLAAEIPNCRALIFADEGHLSPLRNRGGEIFRTLLRSTVANWGQA